MNAATDQDERVRIALHEGPLPAACDTRVDVPAGADIVFEGVVRPLEDERALTALRYEAYEPMTTQELRRLAAEVVAEFGLLGIAVDHSVGVVPVGGVSFRLRVLSAHRKEGLAGMDAFIDRMKQEVPLWKHPQFAGDEEL